MNKLKLGLVAVLMFNLVGCAAISKKEVVQSYRTGTVIMFKVTKNNMDAKILDDFDRDYAPSLDAVLSDFGSMSEIRQKYYLQNGLSKYTYSKTFAVGVLAKKDVNFNVGDIVKAETQNSATLLKFLKIVARKGEDNKNCYWDGSGVICPQENWDYRKDLPEAMK